MAFRVEHDGDGSNLQLIGELDVASAVGVSEVIQLIASSGESIHLDLSKLTFMDSSGLRAIVGVLPLLDQRAELVLIAPTRPVRALLELTGMDVRDSIRIVEGAPSIAGDAQ